MVKNTRKLRGLGKVGLVLLVGGMTAPIEGAFDRIPIHSRPYIESEVASEARQTEQNARVMTTALRTPGTIVNNDGSNPVGGAIAGGRGGATLGAMVASSPMIVTAAPFVAAGGVIGAFFGALGGSK